MLWKPATMSVVNYTNEADDDLTLVSITQLTFATSLAAEGANHSEIYNHPSVPSRFDEVLMMITDNFLLYIKRLHQGFRKHLKWFTNHTNGAFSCDQTDVELFENEVTDN